MKHLTAKVVCSVAGVAVLYICFAFWGNREALGLAIRDMQWQYVPFIIGLTLLNYVFRFLNWQYYLKVLGVTIAWKDSLCIYLAGISMAITPGKVGEVMRSVLLKRVTGTPLAKTVPIVFVDRLTDVIALTLIVGIGSFSFHYGHTLVLTVVVMVISAMAVLMYRPVAQTVLSVLTRFVHLKKYVHKLSAVYESTYSLLEFKRVIVITTISLLGWACEALGFYLTFLAFGVPIAIGSAFFIYAFALIVGAATFAPGGVGLTEGSMAGLLLLLNIGKSQAAAATLLIRVCTLWFGVLLGAFFLIIAQRRFASAEKPLVTE